MTRWMQSATFVCFVLTEAVVWFIVLRVIATALDGSVMNELLIDLERGLGGPLSDPQVAGATALLRDAKDSFTSGPSLLLMVVAAFAAVYLSRIVTELRMSRALAALTGIFGSIVLLNVLLHIALAGDFVVWDNSALTNFLDDPSSRLSGLPQARAFVEAPVPEDLRGSSLVVVTGGMFLMWGRFLFVGRGDVSFDRALRSFTIGFPLVMIAVLFGQATSASTGIYALPYFVLAMLTLAVANAARTVQVDRGLTGSAPWITSALATMGILTAIASLFGLIALLEVEQVVTPLGEVVGRVVGWLLLIIVTPIFWLAQTIMDFFNINPGVFEELDAGGAGALLEDIAEELEDEEDPASWPDWVVDGFRLAVFFTISYALYWIGRVLFARRSDDDDDDAYEEELGVAEGSGLGGLLRGIFPGRRAERVPPWLNRHAIYQLYARIVGAAEERGFRRRPGETPLEFARAATTPLDAELFNQIASEFDRARYGRHFADHEHVRPLDRALSDWERAHPATLELRQAIARELPEDEPPLSPPEPPEAPPGMPQPGML
jgi:hypothetical protein